MPRPLRLRLYRALLLLLVVPATTAPAFAQVAGCRLSRNFDGTSVCLCNGKETPFSFCEAPAQTETSGVAAAMDPRQEQAQSSQAFDSLADAMAAAAPGAFHLVNIQTGRCLEVDDVTVLASSFGKRLRYKLGKAGFGMAMQGGAMTLSLKPPPETVAGQSEDDAAKERYAYMQYGDLPMERARLVATLDLPQGGRVWLSRLESPACRSARYTSAIMECLDHYRTGDQVFALAASEAGAVALGQRFGQSVRCGEQ